MINDKIKTIFGTSKNFENYIKQYLSLFVEMQKIKRTLLSSSCFMDLGSNNFMLRPSTGDIVIIDPLYYKPRN